MPNLTISNLNNRQVSSDDSAKSILTIIHENQIDWMHACGKKGRCTTCKMIVVEGMDNISSLTEVELKYKRSGELRENERLTCQSFLRGDIEIKVAEKYRFPHMIYTE